MLLVVAGLVDDGLFSKDLRLDRDQHLRLDRDTGSEIRSEIGSRLDLGLDLRLDRDQHLEQGRAHRVPLLGRVARVERAQKREAHL